MPGTAPTPHPKPSTPTSVPTSGPTSPGSQPAPTSATELAQAQALIRAEAAALEALAASLDAPPDNRFASAVDLIVRCADANGSVLVTGLGKSGHIGAKISATLASLGIPSHAVHPSEAAHGDLGRFRTSDVVLALSYSGETDEVVNLASILRQDGVKIISITNGHKKASEESDATTAPPTPSSLERLADVALTLNLAAEACEPEFVAPTSSTTATLALGDALAIAAARRRQFTDADFARRHPGGALGGLLKPVVDALRFVAGKNLPLISADLTVQQALSAASTVARRPGALVIIEPDGAANAGVLAGIFTDGDLRRLVLRDAAELSRPIRDVMTKSPRCLPHDALIRDAVRMVREFRQDEIPVVDAAGKPVGVLDVQDLIAMRLVKD